MNPIYLIRHGATKGNIQKKYIGITDEPLCPEGREQLRSLQHMKLYPDQIIVSPMQRTLQTAQILFPGRIPIFDRALTETNFGLFEGKTADELSKDPHCTYLYQTWLRSMCRDPIPGGDDIDMFRHRVCQAFLHHLQQLAPGESAAFVIHGGGIMAIMETFAIPRRQSYAYHIGNGVCLSCVWYNDALHLLSTMPPDGKTSPAR